jgi:hypothetical protein
VGTEEAEVKGSASGAVARLGQEVIGGLRVGQVPRQRQRVAAHVLDAAGRHHVQVIQRSVVHVSTTESALGVSE